MDEFEKLKKDKKFTEAMEKMNSYVPKLIIMGIIWIVILLILIFNLESFTFVWLFKFVLLMIGLYFLRRTLF